MVKNDSKTERVQEGEKRGDRIAQCDVCRARKARQLSMLFESAFVLLAHFYGYQE